MAVKRKSTHRNKKSVSHRAVRVHTEKIKDPGYTVQVLEPNLLRRDLLETLREVILFMQSYEKFKRVQQDKVNLFSELKVDLKELNLLIGSKMKAHFPQGKLSAITESEEQEEFEKEQRTEGGEIHSESIGVARQVSLPRTQSSSVQNEPKHELDALEDQLRDIESQLKDIQ